MLYWSIKFLRFRGIILICGVKAAEDACRTWEVKVNETLSECFAQNWFDRFKVGDMKPWNGWPSVGSYDTFKHKVENNLNIITWKISQEWRTFQDMIHICIKIFTRLVAPFFHWRRVLSLKISISNSGFYQRLKPDWW